MRTIAPLQYQIEVSQIGKKSNNLSKDMNRIKNNELES